MSDSQETQATFEQLPTFYPPNNEKEDFEITHKEFEQLKTAIKDEKFRKLLEEYVDEVQVKREILKKIISCDIVVCSFNRVLYFFAGP